MKRTKPKNAAASVLMMTILGIFCPASHSGGGAAAIPPPAATTIVIRGARVFDSVAGRMLAEQDVVIERDRIKSVTPFDRRTRFAKGATIIDAPGKYVIPGLIDAHVHLVHVLDFAHVTGDEILPLFLAHGVTALRDTGDQVVAQKLLAKYAEDHPEVSPRIFLCSPLIDRDPPYHRDIGWPLTDPNAVAAFVKDMAGWDVTTLKIYVGTERAVGRKVIEEGHRHGKIVTAHLGGYAAQDAVADGVDCLEHIWSVFHFAFPLDALRMPPLDELRNMHADARKNLQRQLLAQDAHLDLNNPTAQALIDALAQKKVMVDPTLVVYRNMLLLADLPENYDHPDNQYVPDRLRRNWTEYRSKSELLPETRELRRQLLRKYQELTGRLHTAGVTLLAGSDAPEPFTPPGGSLHQELELLVESGLSPAAALQTATLHNARALNQEGKLGSIAAGKWADLVLLTRNPLEDIRNTRAIQIVMRGGRISAPKSLLRLVPPN